MITLYQRTDCPFCWKTRLGLAELEVAYESVDLVLGEKHPDVSTLSPVGTVPVLVDDGVVAWESSVILDYLDRRYGDGQLVPSEAAEETRARLLQVYSDKVVGGCLRELVFEKRSRPESEWSQELLRAANANWRSCQTHLEDQLGEREYFAGNFSIADCALAARFGVAEAYGAAVTSEFPMLQRWYERVANRRSWRAAYPKSFIRTPERSPGNDE